MDHGPAITQSVSVSQLHTHKDSTSSSVVYHHGILPPLRLLIRQHINPMHHFGHISWETSKVAVDCLLADAVLRRAQPTQAPLVVRAPLQQARNSPPGCRQASTCFHRLSCSFWMHVHTCMHACASYMFALVTCKHSHLDQSWHQGRLDAMRSHFQQHTCFDVSQQTEAHSGSPELQCGRAQRAPQRALALHAERQDAPRLPVRAATGIVQPRCQLRLVLRLRGAERRQHRAQALRLRLRHGPQRLTGSVQPWSTGRPRGTTAR